MQIYPLFSGSSGNCTLVEHNNTRLLIDVGVTGKAVFSALSQCDIDPSAIDAILVTHEHSDHIKGVGIVSRKLDIPIYANASTWYEMQGKIGEVAEKNIRVFDTNCDFSLKDINILPFSIPHDTAEPVAFSFNAGNKKLTVATDIGHITSDIEGVMKGSDILLLESNHDVDMLKKGPYPAVLKKRILGLKGHLSNEVCGNTLVKLYLSGVKRVILGHLSNENNTEELAYTTVSQILAQSGIGSDYSLKIAHRDRVCGRFEV